MSSQKYPADRIEGMSEYTLMGYKKENVLGI